MARVAVQRSVPRLIVWALLALVVISAVIVVREHSPTTLPWSDLYGNIRSHLGSGLGGRLIRGR